MKSALLASTFDSIENFLATIADALQFDVLLYIFIGLLALLIIMTVVRLRFTYEVRAISSFKKINKYFLRKPYINDSNLVEFNRLMKKIPYQLRDRWQYFMLNREGLPSSYMTLYHCVEQPIKTSNYKSTITMLKYICNICVVLCTLLSLFLVAGTLTGKTLVQALIIPMGFYILSQLYIYFLNAKFNAVSVDLYEYYLAFIRNLDKASASIPDYVDYELLFTEKEIRDGIPVLREYLEKRALLDKIAREKAKQNENEREAFDFTNLGIDGALLVERAMTTSQDYLNTRNRLNEEINKLENEKDKYDSQYISVEKDSQRKLQAIKENLDRLQAQLEASANRIEANYIKKQQSQEKAKQAEIEKNLEDLHVKYAQQVQFLEEEINKRKATIEADKKDVSEQMDAEFTTYNEKVYTILRNKIDQDDADELKVTRAELDTTRDKLASETQTRENLQLTLDVKGQEIDTMQSQIDLLNDKVAKLTSRDRRNIAKMYDENVELKKRVAELEAQLVASTKIDSQEGEPVYYDANRNPVDFSQYYDENGWFKEFPKVYDAEGNYYDFADYYDKYGNPLEKENETSEENEQTDVQEAEALNAQEPDNQPVEENSQEDEEQTAEENVEESTQEGQEGRSAEQAEADDLYAKIFGTPKEDNVLENTELQVEQDAPEGEEQFDNFAEESGDGDVVYYDENGNPVDFEQYYDEDGRFKEFPKVYDKDGNYYDFGDYYDRDGNLLDAVDTISEEDITPITDEDASEQVEFAPTEEERPVDVAEVAVKPQTTTEQPSTQVAEQPVKRGRGRPRKVQTDGDNEGEKPKKRHATRESSTKKGAKKKATKTSTKTAKASSTKTAETSKKSTSANKSGTKTASTSKTGTKKKTGKSGSNKNKATTKTRARKRVQTKPTENIDDELDKLNGQINSENAILEQKQADLKNKISQTLSELQEKPTVDRDLEEIKEIMNRLKAQAAEAKKNGISKEEQQQINKSLAELLRAMSNKSGNSNK